MTDLQDQILDRLVGIPVGADWPNGPLAIAADVVGGTKLVKFGLTDNDRGAKAEIAKRLGYPILLCEAIQGGARGLAESDRRGFAMTVFRTVPIGGKPAKLSALDQNCIAARLAARAHGYVCRKPECPVPAMLLTLTGERAISWPRSEELGLTPCATIGRLAVFGVQWLKASSSREERLAQQALMVIRGFYSGKSVHGWCSVREAVRLAASERGPEDAVDCCLSIARECGMAV